MAKLIMGNGKMNKDSFEKWVKTLGEAWITKNPDLIGSICSENVRYYENPFEEPRVGRQAVIREWQNVPTSQKDITFDFNVIGITNDIGVAHWIASFTRTPENKRETLDGIFTVQLNELGLCTEFHMWWVAKT